MPAVACLKTRHHIQVDHSFQSCRRIISSTSTCARGMMFHIASFQLVWVGRVWQSSFHEKLGQFVWLWQLSSCSLIASGLGIADLALATGLPKRAVRHTQPNVFLRSSIHQRPKQKAGHVSAVLAFGAPPFHLYCMREGVPCPASSCRSLFTILECARAST